MKECPNCKTVMEDDALFCPKCGTKLEVVVEEQVPEEIKCVYCGEEIGEDVDFCPFCGKKQKKDASSPPKKVAEQQPVDSQEPTKEKKEEENIPLTPEELEKAQKKKKIGLGLSAGVILLPFFIRGGAFGFGWYLLIVLSILLSLVFVGKAETENDKNAMDFSVVVLVIIAIIMFIWGPLNPKYY